MDLMCQPYCLNLILNPELSKAHLGPLIWLHKVNNFYIAGLNYKQIIISC